MLQVEQQLTSDALNNVGLAIGLPQPEAEPQVWCQPLTDAVVSKGLLI